MGRGVTPKSADEYMLYHQKRLAQVKLGSRRLAASQIFSPPTSRFDWRQSQTSDRSRKYQPLATMPCSRGNAPVRKVDWMGHVTAGKTVSSGRTAPRAASRWRCGVCGPMKRPAKPTTLMTTSSRIAPPWKPCVARSVRGDDRTLAAEDGISLPELGLIDARPLAVLPQIEPAALAEDRHRVLPDDRLDVRLGDARLAHRLGRLRYLQRIADAPVGGAVDGDALASVVLHQLDHSRLVHLRLGIDGVPRPAA